MVGIDPSPIDVDILKELKDHEIDVNYARKCIEANKKNQVTACYYLLLKKHIQAGGESIADARKPDYDPTVFLKRVPNFKNLFKLSDLKLEGKDKRDAVVKNGASPSLRLNSSSPQVVSPSLRASSMPAKGNITNSN